MNNTTIAKPITAKELYEISDEPKYIAQTPIDKNAEYSMFFEVNKQKYEIKCSLIFKGGC